MIRTVIHEGAISAAKAYGHATVEPRHVLFALARHFRQREGCEACFAPAKSALEPRGSSVGTPAVSEAATALLDTLNSDDDAVAALQKGLDTAGSPSASGGTQAQEAKEAATQAEPGTASVAAGSETVGDILAELDALVGLGPVKAQVRKVIAVVQANTE